MDRKVVLVLVDGMRPIGIEQCKNPYLLDLAKESSYSFKATSVMPSVTLPCHTSIFLSVNPERHGITTNTWMPQVRPIDGICEVVNHAGKKAAMVYNWEELKDLSSPGSLCYSHFERQVGSHDEILAREIEMTKVAASYIKEKAPDFLFMYLGATDETGHNYGWLSDEYLESVYNASECIKLMKGALSEEYQLMITADHGGHDRTHGTASDEDMIIPLILNGSEFEKGRELPSANLKDIAPTIAKVLGLTPPHEWEGKSLI